MPFNMNRTWAQAMALVRGNFQLLAVIAGVFLLLPSLAISIAMPDALRMMTLGEDPEQAYAALSAVAVPMLVYGLIGMVLQLIGYGAMVGLMGADRPTVGEAIMRGLRSLPIILAATLLFALVYLAAMVVLSLLIGVLAAALGTVGGAIAFVLFAVAFVAVFYLMARLSLTLPIIVLEGLRNPVAALRRSFLVTRQSGWQIFAFYVLLAIAYFVISLLVMGVVAVLGAGLGDGPVAVFVMALVNGLIGALVGMVMSGILVSMHGQLAGGSEAAIGDTFA